MAQIILAGVGQEQPGKGGETGEEGWECEGLTRSSEVG